MNYICPEEFRATRPFIELSGHKIQQQQQVGKTRKNEAVVNYKMKGLRKCLVHRYYNNFGNNRRNVNVNYEPNYRYEMILKTPQVFSKKKTYKNLFSKISNYENLYLAFQKAKKGKSKKDYVIKFEKNFENELYLLQWQLMTNTYAPSKMHTFIVRDPKTRKISASHFRDRVIHHAICNIIEPIFESRFIHDSFANRKGKGTLAILKRFKKFQNKVPKGFALKADIRKYFETIDKIVLMSIIQKRIKDKELLQLISTILSNYKTEIPNKGMPLGNLTSQFFANVYLSELDFFVKHELKAKYYVRYVDDFIILHKNKEQLKLWKNKINDFLTENLKLILHKDKTKIISLNKGIPLVGFRIFKNHSILKKSNLNRLKKKLMKFKEKLETKKITKEKIKLSMAGWMGYAKMGNTYNLRQKINKQIETLNIGG